MNMISSLIDKLNKSADEWNGSNMFELARMYRDAADTIWELRDDLQRANDENAKLRDGANAMRQLYEDELKHALAENAKLRELVADLWEYIYIGTAQDGQRLHDRMRELGIEVDG